MPSIERIPCGYMNCFLVSEGEDTILVDTALTKYRETILKSCQRRNIRLIVLTHGHIDHVQNAAYLSERFKAPIAMHRSDDPLIKDNRDEPLSAHTILGRILLSMTIKLSQNAAIPSFEVQEYIKEGDTLEKYGIEAQVIELTGHPKGSIGLLVGQEDLIVGDALMNMIYPSPSLIYGNRSQMELSVNKISQSTAKMIHLGHGKSIPIESFR